MSKSHRRAHFCGLLLGLSVGVFWGCASDDPDSSALTDAGAPISASDASTASDAGLPRLDAGGTLGGGAFDAGPRVDAAASFDAAAGDATAPGSTQDAQLARDASIDGDASSGDVGEADAGEVVSLPARWPRPGESGVCVDTSLRVRFADVPQLGQRGRLRVFDDSSAGKLVAEIDMASSTTQDTVDGISFRMQRRAFVDGHEAVFYLPRAALAAEHSYHVLVESGVLREADGTPFVVDDAESWTFRTGGRAAVDSAHLRVALTGQADFCTVQSALDYVPPGNDRPVTIDIAEGVYHEILHVRAKHQITLHGQGQDKTVIADVNNEKMNGGTAKRALVGIDASHGIVVEDLTIHNRTPQGGSQAEALRMQSCDKCRVRRASIRSLQDTLLWSGRIYAEDCYIEGNVDYIWGTGAAFFERCEIHTAGRNGYIVQSRNPQSSSGYVFVDCRLTSDPGVQGDLLGRIDVGVYPYSQVAFIDCEMGAHIAPVGWQVTGSGFSSGLRFWEYGSHRPDGSKVSVSGRLGSSRQLSSAEAQQLRDPSAVLDGWQPR